MCDFSPQCIVRRARVCASKGRVETGGKVSSTRTYWHGVRKQCLALNIAVVDAQTGLFPLFADARVSDLSLATDLHTKAID